MDENTKYCEKHSDRALRVLTAGMLVLLFMAAGTGQIPGGTGAAAWIEHHMMQDTWWSHVETWIWSFRHMLQQL